MKFMHFVVIVMYENYRIFDQDLNIRLFIILLWKWLTSTKWI